MAVSTQELSIATPDGPVNGGLVVPETPKGLCVLIHGIPSVSPPDPDDTGYPGLAERLAEHGWAAAWADLRGVRSSPGHFSIEGWVRDVSAAVTALKEEDGLAGLRIVLAGSSAGGSVSMVAVARGLQVDGLALLAAPSQWVSFAGSPADAVVRITEQAGMTLAPEVLADPTQWAAEFESVCTRDAARDVDVPVLVLHGDADDVVPVSHATEIADACPDARLEILAGAGHQLRRDDRAIEILIGWLDEVVR